jgi:hypothetical protein
LEIVSFDQLTGSQAVTKMRKLAMEPTRDLTDLEADRLPMVPPYQVMIDALRNSASGTTAPAILAVPRQLFEFLLSRALRSLTFDEASYLSANPDVRDSIERGEVATAKEHFCRYGYFEHRVGGTPIVDEAWYLVHRFLNPCRI